MFSFSHTFHCAASTGREPVHSLLVNRSHGRAVDGRKNGCWYGDRSAGFDGGFDGVAHEGCCVVLPMGDCRIPRTAMYRQSGKCRLGQDISARSGGETGEQRRPILRLVLAGLALVHDLVLIVVHDRPLVLLLIQLQLLVSIPSPQPKLSLILIYRNHWQNANRVSAHSESSHNPYTHASKRSHAALPVALFTPLSFRRSLPPVNAVHQLLPCWFASQARSSYLSAR